MGGDHLADGGCLASYVTAPAFSLPCRRTHHSLSPSPLGPPLPPANQTKPNQTNLTPHPHQTVLLLLLVTTNLLLPPPSPPHPSPSMSHPHLLRFPLTTRQLAFLALALLSGTYLLHTTHEAAYFAVVKRAPAVGTLWVWSVVELELGWAVVSVVGVAVGGWLGGYWGF